MCMVNNKYISILVINYTNLFGAIINISIKCNNIIPINDIRIIVDFIDNNNEEEIENFRNNDDDNDDDDDEFFVDWSIKLTTIKNIVIIM